jgi:hypothetical protein
LKRRKGIRTEERELRELGLKRSKGIRTEEREGNKN